MHPPAFPSSSILCSYSLSPKCSAMAAISVSFIIGIIGNIISILVFLSPVATFKRVVKKKSTEDFKGLPYVCTLLSTSLWTFYGLLKPGGLLVVTVNGAGAVLQAIYVTLFLIYAPKDTKVKYLKLAGILNIGCLGLVIAVVLLALHGPIRLTAVGILCAGLTLGMYASPLAAMRTVIRTESVEYMPFFLSFFLFLNGGVWSAYAVLVKDFYIGVPNAIGFILGSAQLILYVVYKGKSESIKSSEKMKKEGSVHLVRDGLEMGEGHLSKERSIPKQSVSSQHNIQKTLKTHSSAYELESNTPFEKDVENGDGNKHDH